MEETSISGGWIKIHKEGSDFLGKFGPLYIGPKTPHYRHYKQGRRLWGDFRKGKRRFLHKRFHSGRFETDHSLPAFLYLV